MVLQNIIMAAAAASLPATPHRYWRVVTTASASGIYGAMAEVELHNTIGGSDLTVSGGPATSGAVHTTNVAANAIDNNTSTIWLSDGTSYATAWWQYDFAGTPRAIVEISMTITSNCNSQAPTAFSLQYSDNNTTFVLSKSWTTTAWPAATTTRVFN